MERSPSRPVHGERLKPWSEGRDGGPRCRRSLTVHVPRPTRRRGGEDGSGHAARASAGEPGSLELVPNVARRALELGLSAREPSFHVFVAAEPEVMIEDDIVRYAARFASERPTPA